jgi:phage tail-like protein
MIKPRKPVAQVPQSPPGQNQLKSQPQSQPNIYEHIPNYITTNRFYVEMESMITASFSECSGFGVNIQKETYFEGGVNDQQRIFLGHAEFTEMTLKRGMTDDLTFWNWVTSTISAPTNKRRNVNILLFNQAGETIQTWTLIGAIPTSWKAPGFQADGNSVAIEELTLSYEGLNVKVKQQGNGGASIDLGRDASGFFAPN